MTHGSTHCNLTGNVKVGGIAACDCHLMGEERGLRKVLFHVENSSFLTSYFSFYPNGMLVFAGPWTLQWPWTGSTAESLTSLFML